MSWIDLISAVAARSGVAALAPQRGPLILMYHAIGGPDGVAPDAFAKQVRQAW